MPMQTPLNTHDHLKKVNKNKLGNIDEEQKTNEKHAINETAPCTPDKFTDTKESAMDYKNRMREFVSLQNDSRERPGSNKQKENKNCTCSIKLIFNCFQPLNTRN